MKEKLHQELLLFAQKIFNQSNPLDHLQELQSELLSLYKASIILEHMEQKKDTQTHISLTELVSKNHNFTPQKETPLEIPPPKKQEKRSVNEAASRGTIGLNDRIAFMAHLFDGSSIAYNDAIEQLNTMLSYQAVSQYIDELKAQHNNWAGKEEYEERLRCVFMRKFGVKTP